MYSGKPSVMSRSVPTTPQQDKEKEVYGGARPKIPSTNKTAFQDYTSEMMKALNNPWNPRGRKATTSVGAKIAPLVYLVLSGTSEEEQSTKKKGNEETAGINMPALDKTELVPDNLSQVKNPASPVKFTKEVMNGAALREEPKETSLLKMIGFEAQEEVNLEPDFYMPDGKGGKLSDTKCMFTTSSTPEGNPGVVVQLDNLKEKYGASIFLLDKRSGNLYVLEAGEYRKIEEKGLLFPSESMIMAGALEREVGEPQPSMQISKMQATPAAESTRIPLRTSTEKREKSLSSEQLLDLELSKQYRQELKEAEESMLQACLEKSNLESQEAELIRFRTLKAQKEFWDLERKRDENRKTTERVQEKIKELDQAVASSSKLMKELKRADTQYLAMGQTIADFWDTSDVPQDDDATRIPSYPSLESLDQEHKEELSDIQYAYYSAKREAIMKKIDTAYEIYSAHLKEYEEADPKRKTQKYLLQYNDISNRLHGQFEVVTSMLGLPFKETLDTYPSLDSIMRVVEQEDLREKGESFFKELMGEIEIKNAIAAKVYQNKSLEVTSSKGEIEMTREFEEYKKESGKLMDFCKRMIDKRGKREEYEELEQPQGVPDVRPISTRELDEKIKEALITPKRAQNIGENTIPLQYSREISRYEPPIPVKEKKKEDLLEKVREITSGESKGSKDEKQAEGETELSWDHEGLEPYPSPERPKPQRDPKEKGTSKENMKGNETLNRDPKDEKSQEDGEESLKRAKEKLVSPKPKGTIPKELEKDSDFKKGHPREGSGVDRDTEQWVNDQNKFREKKRGNLEETIPKVFEPQAPVKILQRGKQPQSEVAKQTPIRTGVNRDSWKSSYGGPNYRSGYQMGYPSENRNWEQRNGYGRRYGNGNKNQQRRAHGETTTQTQTHYTTPKGRVPYGNTPSRRMGGGQGNGDGNGEDKDDKNRKRYRDTKYDFEEEDEEESDTEDSFEFEITPQQLSQVTPGGGVLKLTLTKKGPLKITIEAQNKRPDPSQTTVKTAYDLTKEKKPSQRSESIKAKTTSRRRENFENQIIKPIEAPNDKRDRNFPEGGGPVRQIKPGGTGGPDGNREPDKGRKPPRKGKGPPDGLKKK